MDMRDAIDFYSIKKPNELKRILCIYFTPVTRLAASFGSVPVSRDWKKERSEFFQRSKSSGVPVTQPAGWGGKSHKLIS